MAWFVHTWQTLERKKDRGLFLLFLRESKKELNKTYAGLTNQKWIDFVGNLLKLISCELSENSINSKKVPK